MRRIALLSLVLVLGLGLTATAQADLLVGIDRDYSTQWDSLASSFEADTGISVWFQGYAQSSIAQQIVLQSFARNGRLHFMMVPRSWASTLSAYLEDLSNVQSDLLRRGVSIETVNNTPLGVTIPFASDWFLGVSHWPEDLEAAVEFLAAVGGKSSSQATEIPTSPQAAVATIATQKASRDTHNPVIDGSLSALINAATATLGTMASEMMSALPSSARMAIEGIADLYGVPFSASTSTVTVVLESAPGASAANVAALSRLGVRQSAIETSSASGLIKVDVPLAQLADLASQLYGVAFIRPPYTPYPLGTPSQGPSTVGADAFHAAGITGAGVKVAVIDLGFSGLSQAQARGDLPYSVLQNDLTGSGLASGITHGTAVAEVIHDMAPDAELHLIKIADEVDLDLAVTYCLNNGIDIINHSLGWYNTNNYDGTGTIADAAQRAISGGILWVNAAGNEAESHWEGAFADGNADGWHDQDITFYANAGSQIVLFLTWNDWPQASSDYDMYLFDPSSGLVASSTKFQTGTEEPTESIQLSAAASGTYTVRFQGSGSKTLELYALYQSISPVVTSSSILAPANVADVVTVAAIDFSNYTTGPQQPYSSQGPTNDGRAKPDLAAPDNVATGTSPYTTFPGTSGAAPQVAGAAALLLEQNPLLNASALRSHLLTQTVFMGNIYAYGSGRLALQPPVGANTPPTAAFSISPSSGQPGSIISFNGSASTDSDGSIVSYVWDFGDGSSASGITAAHAYGSAGTYTVTLMVTDNGGATGSATDTVSIQVAALPDLTIQTFDYAPASPTIGQNLAFTITVRNQGTASAGLFRVRLEGAAASAQSYFAQLGAGSSQTITLNLPLTAASETFTVTVDDIGQVSESNEANNAQSVLVTAAAAPPVAEAGGPYAGTAGSSIAFDGSASTGSISTYVWSFGDGGSAQGVSVSHTYTNPGTYTASLTVYGSGGLQSTDTATVVVNPATPQLTAQLSLPKTTYEVGESLVITYTLNRPAYIYLVDATADGTVYLLSPNWTQPSPYAASGAHIFPDGTGFSLTISQPTGVETLHIFAATGPIPGFPTSFSAGAFSVLSTNPVSFRDAMLSTMQSQFSSGDWAYDALSFNVTAPAPTTGTIRAISSPSAATVEIDGIVVGTTPHDETNVSTGLHTVEFSKAGYQSETRQVLVSAGAISTIHVTLSPIPTTGTIRALSSPTGATVRIDGIAVGTTPHDESGVTPGVHTVEFTKSGYQPETRQVSVSIGAVSTVQVTLTPLPVNDPPVASFTVSPSPTYVGDTVFFDGSGSYDPDGSITSYDWDFGDGTTATGASVSHVFPSNGTYSVVLTVTDNEGGQGSQSQDVLVDRTANIGWISPVSHEDPADNWQVEGRAYDEDLEYNAQNYEMDGKSWCSFLILYTPEGGLQSDRIRFMVADAFFTNELTWDVDVYRDGAWVDVFDNDYQEHPERKWIEVAFDQGLVTAMRLRAYNHDPTGTLARVYEADFHDATVP